MINVVEYISMTNSIINVECTDGQIITGILLSIDDEEESGLGEMGITINTPYGRIVGIAESEIEAIRIQ